MTGLFAIVLVGLALYMPFLAMKVWRDSSMSLRDRKLTLRAFAGMELSAVVILGGYRMDRFLFVLVGGAIFIITIAALPPRRDKPASPPPSSLEDRPDRPEGFDNG